MLKKKFEVLLKIMELFFREQGYHKSRKKGEYYKIVSGRIIKCSIVLSRIMKGGNLGEIRIFIALEYPEVEKLVSMLKNEQYKKGKNIFCQDIGIFCGERAYHAFNFCGDSNMEYIGITMREILVQYIFPAIRDYENDDKILDKFEDDNTSWRANYFSGGHANIDFYLRWISLCILNGYIRETAIILENIPDYYRLDREIEAIKDGLGGVCLDKKQVDSFYLFVNNKIRINPDKKEIKKGLLQLDGINTYFLILEETTKGNYLQIAGGSGEFTVEIRMYDDHGYQHYRSETRSEDKSARKILYGESYLSLQVCQVLSIQQSYEIACKFLIDQKLHENYNWIKLNI